MDGWHWMHAAHSACAMRRHSTPTARVTSFVTLRYSPSFIVTTRTTSAVRVYVDLETTPFIARTDPAHQFVLHDGDVMSDIDQVCLTEKGELVFSNSQQIAMLDNRDLAQCLPLLKIQGKVVDDEQLMQWLALPTDDLSLSTLEGDRPVRWVRSDRLAASFGFIKRPEKT
jgi:hypothetical protein